MSAPRNSTQKCIYCRVKKKKCSYNNGLWPSRCGFCQLRDLPCSEPQLARNTRKTKKPCQERTPAQLPLPQTLSVNLKPIHAANRIPNTPPSVAITHSLKKHESKEAILLLSVNSVLMMAIKDMNGMAIDIMQPVRRDPLLEHEEESIPVLQNAITDFKAVARTIKARMLSIGKGMEFSHAQDALNALAEPYFREELTWGVDQTSLRETKDTIAYYYEHGHAGLAYVLQIKLLRWGVKLTLEEMAKLLLCKQLFADETEALIRRGHLDFPHRFQDCQMFTPKELVRIPALASQILQDKRPDYLGRSSFHILLDTDIPIEWVEPLPGGLMRSIHFSSRYGSSVEWPLAAINNTDILGRTTLHLAVRHCSRLNVIRLVGLGANMHCICLNNLSLLHIAACHGHATMIQHLIEYGQYMHVLDELDGLRRTPFWYAARGAHFEVMEVLTSSANVVYVNMEHEDFHGHSPLATAARNAHVEVLAWLLERRPENWKMYAPGTPNNEHLLLAYAVQSKSAECTNLIKRFRTWTFGDDIFESGMQYAAENNDANLRKELQSLYQYDFLLPKDDVSRCAHHPSRKLSQLTTISALASSDLWRVGVMRNVPT